MGAISDADLSEPTGWLDDVVILNESSDERSAGKVEVFRSEGDAVHALTPWPVHQSRIFGFTAAGTRLKLSSGDDDDYVVERETCAHGGATVLDWLMAAAVLRLDRRRRDAAAGRVALAPYEVAGQLPTTVEGLLAYVGLPPARVGPNWALLGCAGVMSCAAIMLLLTLHG